MSNERRPKEEEEEMTEDVLLLKTYRDGNYVAVYFELGDGYVVGYEQKWAFGVSLLGRCLCLVGVQRDGNPHHPLREWGFLWDKDGPLFSCGFSMPED